MTIRELKDILDTYPEQADNVPIFIKTNKPTFKVVPFQVDIWPDHQGGVYMQFTEPKGNNPKNDLGDSIRWQE